MVLKEYGWITQQHAFPHELPSAEIIRNPFDFGKVPGRVKVMVL